MVAERDAEMNNEATSERMKNVHDPAPNMAGGGEKQRSEPRLPENARNANEELAVIPTSWVRGWVSAVTFPPPSPTGGAELGRLQLRWSQLQPRMGFRRRELHKKQMEDAETTPGAAVSRAYDDEPDWEAGWCRALPKHVGCDDV